MNAIAFSGDDFKHLRNRLLGFSPNEAAAILLGGFSRLDGFHRLLVRETVSIPADAYLDQDEQRVVISPAFLAPLLKRAKLEGWSLIFVHSHPFSDDATFSHVDDLGEGVLLPAIFNRAPDRPHGSMVLGKKGLSARVWLGSQERERVDLVTEVAGVLRRNERDGRQGLVESMFDRSIRAFGLSGQRILSRLTVAVVGLGGTGSIVTQQLAHLGVSSFILLDTDVVAASNLNRLVGASPDSVGRSKVDVASGLIRSIRPNASITAVHGSAVVEREAKELLKSDFIFCCTDTHGSRAVINQIAYQYFIPAIDLGVRIDARRKKVQTIVGRVQMLAPGLPCLVCQNLLDPEEVRRDLLSGEERMRDPYIVGGGEPQPAVISLNGVVASMAVTMFLSATVGLPMNSRHQIYLADRGTVRSVESVPIPHCIVSSKEGALGRGDLWSLPWRTD